MNCSLCTNPVLFCTLLSQSPDYRIGHNSLENLINTIGFETEVPVVVFDPGDSRTTKGRFAFVLAAAQTRDTCPADIVLAVIIVGCIQITGTWVRWIFNQMLSPMKTRPRTTVRNSDVQVCIVWEYNFDTLEQSCFQKYATS